METAHSTSRLYGLDILRAAAITFVMVSHGYEYTQDLADPGYYDWLIMDGVGLFFVLSGFLIGGILIRNIEAGPFGARELFHFLTRRWLRTLPAYFCVLVFLIGCYYLSRGQLPPKWPQYFVFTQNFAGPHPLFFGVAWSLSVEEWFYLLVPLGLFFLLRLSGREKRWLILGLILFVLILVTSIRLYKVHQYDYFADGTLGDRLVKVVITRLDGIMYGVLAAWLGIYFNTGFYKYKNRLLIAGLVLLVICNTTKTDFFRTRIYYSLMPTAALCMLPALSAIKEGRGILYEIVTFISLISYSMYLTNHMIVQRGILPVITKWMELEPGGNRWHGLAAWFIFWLLTVLSAYALYRFIERPFMRLREKLNS